MSMSMPMHTAPRTAIAVFDTYTDAERAVDTLSDRHFPVDTVAIVGRGLYSVEQITGRLTTAGAAWRGAVSGAFTGLFIGFFFGILSWVDPLVSVIHLEILGVVFGAVLGGVVGTVVHLLQGGRRNFSSVNAMVPDHYELLVDAGVGERARILLHDTNRVPASIPDVSTDGDR